MNLFAPLVVSSVTAAVLSRTFFGSAIGLKPRCSSSQLTQLPWFLLLGIFCGVAGALFLRALRQAEEMFAKLPLPLYGRLGVAGLIVGIIALAYPQVWGNGYGAIDPLLRQEPEILFVMGLFAAKFVATSVSVGAGTVGGVFTPTLLLGAAAGSLFEAILHQQGWALALPTGCFALVGMGGTLAATTHSPLLAMIMLFELSLNYSLMPPLMLACAVATLVARRLHPQSIYTEPLLRKRPGTRPRKSPSRRRDGTNRRGLDAAAGSARARKHPFRAIAERFLTLPNNFLPWSMGRIASSASSPCTI
jgi:CIC family chloride channel protein